MGIQEFLNSLEYICILVTLTYLLSRTNLFDKLFFVQDNSPKDRWVASLFFCFISLTDIALFQGRNLLSARALGATTAGLFGGPILGAAVGLFTGCVSFLLTAHGFINDGIAAIIGGLLGGWIYRCKSTYSFKMGAGFAAGTFSQVIWLMLMFWPEPNKESPVNQLILDYSISAIANGASVFLLLTIVRDMHAHQERIERSEIGKVIQTANTVLPKLGTGFTYEAALEIAESVRRLTGFSSVCIAGKNNVLAFTGVGADHHSQTIGVAASKCLDQKCSSQMTRPDAFICSQTHCTLAGVYAKPLFYEDQIIGCMEMYYSSNRYLGPDAADLGMEIAQFLFNHQMQMLELERQAQAVARAELKALQAQIHPHFLFNALNTVAALCELDPHKAGLLTVKLGHFFRSTLKNRGNAMCTLYEELQVVRNYLEIERARLGDRLDVTIEVGLAEEDLLLPTFTLQPIVENAVLHGIAKKKNSGKLRIVARKKGNRLICWISDDGNGIDSDIMKRINSTVNGEAHAISMLQSRLKHLYSDQFGFNIRSTPGKGAVVCLWVPLTIQTK